MSHDLQLFPARRDDAATNMARDDTLHTLRAAPGEVCFRSYGWTEPALTFGYSQRMATVMQWADALEAGGVTLVRRPTGGGIVDHRHDLTYAIAFPRTHPAYRQSPAAVYRTLHRALAATLGGLGVPARLASEAEARAPRPPAGERACFDAPESADVVAPDGRKLAGAALRRGSAALLVQGSLARPGLPPELTPEGFAASFAGPLAEAFGLGRVTPRPWPGGFPAPAAVQAFRAAEWNQRR